MNIFVNPDLILKSCSVVIIWNSDLAVNNVHWMCSATTRFLHTPDFPLYWGYQLKIELKYKYPPPKELSNVSSAILRPLFNSNMAKVPLVKWSHNCILLTKIEFLAIPHVLKNALKMGIFKKLGYFRNDTSVNKNPLDYRYICHITIKKVLLKKSWITWFGSSSIDIGAAFVNNWQQFMWKW